MSSYYLSHEWFRIRRRVMRRDAGRCRYCGARGTRVDHITPRGRGGRDHPDNLATACPECDTVAGGKWFPDLESKREWIRRVRGLEDA